MDIQKYEELKKVLENEILDHKESLRMYRSARKRLDDAQEEIEKLKSELDTSNRVLSHVQETIHSTIFLMRSNYTKVDLSNNAVSVYYNDQILNMLDVAHSLIKKTIYK